MRQRQGRQSLQSAGIRPPFLDFDALIVVVVDADTYEGPLLFKGPTPLACSDGPRLTAYLIPPVYASHILSPPVLVSNPSKSGATVAVTVTVAVYAAINKPNIEVNEADDGGGVNFMVYASAVFGGLLLVGGAPYSSWTP